MKILSKLNNTGMIEEAADKRYVTDAEKLAWNNKVDKTQVLTNVPANAKFTDTVYTHPSTHPASMITGLPTSLPANGGDATTSKHLVGDDTRSVNSSPSVYMSGGSRYVSRAGWQTEFKNVSTIGLTGLLNGTYCYLQTHTPWSDPSGGYPIQVAYGNGTPCWRVGVSTSAWSAWQKVSDGGNANTVNGFTVGVNVPSDAKFTDTIVDISGKADKTYVDNKVKTDVPLNAKFTDTITTINNKTGAITKADIVALGIPAQDTVVDISGKADKAYVDDKVEANIITVLKAVYPVGAIYTSVTATNPATIFGFGTWAAFGAGRTLVGVNTSDTDFSTVEKTGGSKTNTLAVANLPSHTHTFTGDATGSAGAHSHTITVDSGGSHSHTASSNSTGAHTHTVSGTAASAGAHTHTQHPDTWMNRTTADGYVPTSGAFVAQAQRATYYTGSAGAHTHTVSGTAASAGAHSHTITVSDGGSHSHTASSNSTGAHTHTVSGSNANTGSGTAFNTMDPYITVYMWKRTA